MGEAQQFLFEPGFNRAIKVRASDMRITSDSGFILLRGVDHRLRLTDPRQQDLVRYKIVKLLQERVYGLALGYSAQDDADRLAHDLASKHWTNDSSASPSNHG